MKNTKAKVATETAKPFFLVCPKADIRRVLSTDNVRWREGDIGSLLDFKEGDSEPDVVVYAVVGDTAYAVDRTLLWDQHDGNLRVFASDAPTAVDISHLFNEETRPGDVLLVDEGLRDILVEKVIQARENVINSWVAALKKTPHEWNLSRLMRQMQDKSVHIMFGQDVLIEPICLRLNQSRWDFGTRLMDVMSRETFRLPEWLGTGPVQAHIYMQNGVGDRYWSKVKEGRYLGNLLGLLRLDQGPLAVVTAKSEKARDYCERLIKKETYGDVMLLIGDGPELKQEAQRLSDYLFGVDIIER